MFPEMFEVAGGAVDVITFVVIFTMWLMFHAYFLVRVHQARRVTSAKLQGAKRVSELHKGSSGNSGIFKEYISRRKGGARGKGAGADSTQQQGSTSTKESKRKKAFEMAELATLST